MLLCRVVLHRFVSYCILLHRIQSSDPASTKIPKEERGRRPENLDLVTPVVDGRLHPCAEGESGTFHRYTGSCSLFLQCLRGRSVLLSCEDDLVFDIDRKMCVQEVTGCDAQSEEGKEFGDLESG